jgi:signal peptidase I
MNTYRTNQKIRFESDPPAPGAKTPGEAGGNPRGSPGGPERIRGRPPDNSVLGELLSLLIKISVICILAILLLTFVYGVHRAEDGDMHPAIKDGDLVVFYRLDKDYAAKDILLLSFRGRRRAARVVAVRGDTVDITENGLMINGAFQQELNIYEPTRRYAEGTELPVTPGESQVFVLGDSRENATDSRVYGAVNTKDTLGTVIAVIRRRNL